MEKKCSCCGSGKLVEYRAYEEQYLESFVDAYLCLDCHHVEFFANEYSRMFKIALEREAEKQFAQQEINIREKKIADLENEVSSLSQKSGECEKIVEELKELLKSEEITVREQKELLVKLEIANENSEQVQEELYSKKHEIEVLEQEISYLKKKL